MLGNLSPPLLGQVLTPVQRWAHVLKDQLRGGVTKIPKTKKIEDVDAVAGDVKAIRAFIERLDITKLPADVKESYEHSIDYFDYHHGALIDIQDKAAAKGREEGIKEAREKGFKVGRENAIKEGREEGIKEGEENVLKGIAKRLKAQGKSSQEIAEMTCRSLEFVERLLSPQYEGSAGR
jgi:flagellar biosynthesis/type III secretory pathway protein FliH